MSVGIPLKVLYDAIGTSVALQLTNGQVYSGILAEVQENMNILLKSAMKSSKSGKVVQMQSVFLRGANIVFFQLPDALQMSPALLAAGKAVAKALDMRGEGKGFASTSRRRAH